MTAAMIEGNNTAKATPNTPAVTEVIRLTRSSFRGGMHGSRKVLYKSTAREVESMNRIASVALSSAEKIDASAQMPSHLGSNNLIAVGSASSGLAKWGSAAKAQQTRTPLALRN